jgi:RNA polymerase sigma-70 factor (ECF subfamily)
MTGDPLEISLIKKAKMGDVEAFNDLFEREKRYLYNLMLQLTGDAATADDLAQEAFVKAYRKLSGFRSQASFRTWLTRIAINIFRNDHRKKARHNTLNLADYHVPDYGDQPECLIIRGELQFCILHTLHHHIPKKYREVLVLRDFHNMSYNEISRILGWNMGLTKTNLRRARLAFRDQFAGSRCRAFADNYLCICEGILSL